MTGAISNEDYLKIKLKRAHFIAERTLRCIQILISGLKNTCNNIFHYVNRNKINFLYTYRTRAKRPQS